MFGNTADRCRSRTLPKVKKAFPAIEVTTLYAGSADRHGFSPLTVATTHQLFRFIEAFDVIIVDEVDAFPYSIDDSARYAVNKSKGICGDRLLDGHTFETDHGGYTETVN